MRGGRGTGMVAMPVVCGDPVACAQVNRFLLRVGGSVIAESGAR
jgi:hypothetical protein